MVSSRTLLKESVMLALRGWLTILLLTAAVSFGHSNSASAQLPPVTEGLPSAPLTNEQIENPPKREIKIELLTEPLKRTFNGRYATLAEQRFMATLQFALPELVSGDPRAVDSSHKLYALQYLGDAMLLSPSRSGSSRTLRESFARFIKETPEDRLPQEARDFFTAEEVNFGFVIVGGINTSDFRLSSRERESGDGKAMLDIRVLGKTAEQCEQRARALVTMFDYGFSRPLQREILARRDEQAVKFTNYQQDYLRIGEEASALTKSLAAYADLSNEMLTGLQLQQRESEIALAGVKSRLAACEKALAKAQEGASRERTNQIEAAKLAAEFDAADWEARHAKATELVTRVKARIDVSEKLAAANTRLPELRGYLRSYRSTVQRHDRDLLRHAPLPLVDGKIVIQPLEWATP
jgi:hypothetical protein